MLWGNRERSWDAATMEAWGYVTRTWVANLWMEDSSVGGSETWFFTGSSHMVQYMVVMIKVTTIQEIIIMKTRCSKKFSHIPSLCDDWSSTHCQEGNVFPLHEMYIFYSLQVLLWDAQTPFLKTSLKITFLNKNKVTCTTGSTKKVHTQFFRNYSKNCGS